MTSRSVEPASPLEAEGIPDLEGSTAPTADPFDSYGQAPPRDAPLLSDDFGTTAAELRSGEPLDGRLAREEPDVLAQADVAADDSPLVAGANPGAGQGVGRLVSPDEGARPDEDPDLVATDAGTDLGGYSAEEAAMHLEPEV